MSSLPKGWELCRLDDIAEVRLGRQRSPKNHAGTQMRPYLRAANVDWAGLQLSDIKHMNFTDDEMAIYKLRPGDIVLGEASGSPGEVGKPGLWTGEIDDCAFQNTLVRVRSHGPEPRYLLHYFRHLARSGAFADESRGVGIHHIGRAKLAAWLIPVPPASEQQRIVEAVEDHLSRLDVAEQDIADSVSRSTQLRRSILVTRLGSGAGISPFAVLDDVAVVIDCEHRTAKKARIGEEYALSVRTTDIAAGRIDSDRAKRVSKETFDLFTRRATPEPGDLVLSREAPVGQVGVIDGRYPICLGQRTVLIQCQPFAILPRFLMHLLLAPRAQRWMSEHSTGTTVLHLNVADVRRIPIGDLPDLAAQDRLVAELDEAMAATDHLVEQSKVALSRSRALRWSLFEAAFSGRLTGASRYVDQIEEMAGV